MPDYKAGVFWVGLASLRDPGLVGETIAQTLGAKDGLADHIAERQMLFLLDNLEQVIEAAAELGALVSACPNLACSSPAASCCACKARSSTPCPRSPKPKPSRFFADAPSSNPREIPELCARLDNLPLASSSPPPARKRSPWHRSRTSRSRLDLSRAAATAIPANRPSERPSSGATRSSRRRERLFARLAVFAGGCARGRGGGVRGRPRHPPVTRREEPDPFLDGRYWMLETIEDYAAQRLAQRPDAATTGARHTHFFVTLAEQAQPWLRGPDPTSWLDVLEREHDNIRATLARLREQGASELELRLAVAVGDFWCIRGLLAEGRLTSHTLSRQPEILRSVRKRSTRRASSR